VFGSRENDTGVAGMSYSVSRQSGVSGSVLLIQFLGGVDKILQKLLCTLAVIEKKERNKGKSISSGKSNSTKMLRKVALFRFKRPRWFCIIGIFSRFSGCLGERIQLMEKILVSFDKHIKHSK